MLKTDNITAMTHHRAHKHDPRLEGPFIFLDDAQTPAPRFYHRPIHLIQANHVDEVQAAFEQLKQAHEAGHHLAGYISYELGLTFEPTLAHRLPQERATPLLCFGVFDGFTDDIPPELLYTATPQSLSVTPSWSQADYLNRFEQVQGFIKSGDCYQINLTFPMHGKYDGDPLALYASLRHRQAAKYGGYVRLGGPDLLSLSPELFFKKDAAFMSMRPMKGTLKRNPDSTIDKQQRAAMATDLKSRAENLMIVDLLRNDLSRLSKAGSVKVPDLFALETYPTLHQMTSRVTSELNDGTNFREIFQSLFPCGSVTGAPKIRAMEIIDQLETAPRGAYCGAMGYVDPNGDACFNVGIRTLSIKGQDVAYHVGSGVVLDSDGRDEYEECLLKAKVLQSARPHFIETFYYDSDTGYRYIGHHLNRLSKAVKDEAHMHSLIARLAHYEPSSSPARIRLTVEVSDKANITITDTALQTMRAPMRLALSKYRLTPARQNFEHKISARDFYDGERKRIKNIHDIDEVIFLNDAGELCEGSFTNIFIEKNGLLLTPAIQSGLLGGVLRRVMIEQNQVQEARLTLDDLKASDAVYAGNSLRGLMPAQLIISDI